MTDVPDQRAPAPRRFHLRLHHRAARHAGARHRHSGAAEARGRFPGGDAARGADYLGLFGTAWALMQFLCSPIHGALGGSFRTPAGHPDFQFRARPRLHADGAFAEHLVAVRRPRDLRHQRSQHFDRLCLHCRRHAAGRARRAFRHAGRGLRRRLCVRSGARRARRRCRSAPAVLDRCRAQPAQWALRCFWYCRNRCRAKSARAFSWRRANPVGSLKLLRSQPRLLGLASVNFLGSLAHASLPSIGVLYMMFRYDWSERTVGFTMAGVGLCAMIVQGGLIGPTVKRFGERSDADHWTGVRARGFRDVGTGADRVVLLAWHSAAGALGFRQRRLARLDEPSASERASRASCRAPMPA